MIGPTMPCSGSRKLRAPADGRVMQGTIYESMGDSLL